MILSILSSLFSFSFLGLLFRSQILTVRSAWVLVPSEVAHCSIKRPNISTCPHLAATDTTTRIRWKSDITLTIAMSEPAKDLQVMPTTVYEISMSSGKALGTSCSHEQS